MYGFIAILDNDGTGKKDYRPQIDERISQLLPSYSLCHRSLASSVYFWTKKPSVFGCTEVGTSGVILGKMFRKINNKSLPVENTFFTQRVISLVEESGCQSLVSDVWGQYVGIITHRESGNTFVLCSPLCGLPVYIAHFNAFKIVFSNPADIAKLGIASWTINWDYLNFKERFINIETGETGFNEVEKILGGTCKIIRKSSVETQNYWTFDKLCRPEPFHSTEEAARMLRDTVVDCVGAWADCFDRIGLRLSGGLDSSVVACALHLSGVQTKIWCHTFYGPTVEGDERAFARAVASKTGYPLTEIADRWQNQRYDLLPYFPLGGEPWDDLISAFRGPTEYPIVEQFGLDAMFSGMAGDAIFYQGGSNFSHDELKYSGISINFLHAARNASRSIKQSIWKLLWESWCYRNHDGKQSIRSIYEQKRSPLMRAEQEKAAIESEMFHKYCQEFTGLPIGKTTHVACARESQRIFACGPNLQQYLCIDPLASQPIFELCLSMPLRMLVWKGWDRGLTRLAFSDVLPECVLRREAKGGISNFHDDVFTANLPLFRKYFGDSELVRAGILDEQKVRESLLNDSGQGNEARGQFLVTIAVEVWARRWKEILENNDFR